MFNETDFPFLRWSIPSRRRQAAMVLPVSGVGTQCLSEPFWTSPCMISCMSSNVGICNASSLSIRPDDNLLPMKRNLKFLIDLSTSFPKTCFLWSLSSGERLGLMDWPDRLFLLSGGGGLPSTSDKFRAVDFHCTHGSRLRLLQKWNFCEGWSGETYWKTWMVEVDSYKNKKWDWSTRTFLRYFKI